MPWSDKAYQREYIKTWRKARREKLRLAIDAIREKTVCEICGNQPIDFHRKEHEAHPAWRICNLLRRAAPFLTILEEIARCQPLCRRCHLTVDGRIHNIEQRGEGHWNSRLTLTEVAQIRGSAQSDQALADQFGVKPRQIRKIRGQEQWR
jgi:hypothetical protein